MKKIISILSAAAICAAIVPGAVYAANGDNYSTDFSSLQTGGSDFEGWTFNDGSNLPWFSSDTTKFCDDDTASIIADADTENGTCLKLVPSNNAYAGAVFDTGITGGVYKISFEQKSGTETTTNMRVRLTDGTKTKEVLYLSENSGNILNTEGNAAISKNQAGDTVKLSAEEWSTVDLIVNMNTKKVIRVINGRGSQAADISELSDVSSLLIAGNTQPLYIDNFSVTRLDDEAAYAEPDSADDLINTNFTKYVDYAFNVAASGEGLTLGNAAWRGCAYTALTDRGISMKLNEERQSGYDTATAKELTFSLPNSVTGGVYTTEVWVKPMDSALPEFLVRLIGKHNTSDINKDAVKTDTTGKVTAPSAAKDMTGQDLKLTSNAWNKIEVVYDMDHGRIYSFVNGYGVGSIPWGATEFNSILISAGAGGCDMYIDDLRVYNEDSALYGAATPEGYIEYEDFTAMGTKVSNAGGANVMDFNRMTFGNAAWRGSAYATKTDKGISLCMGDPTGNTLAANKYNDVTWTPAEILSDTDGVYVIGFNERFDSDTTCKLTIRLYSSDNAKQTEFVISDDGYLSGGNSSAHFEKGKWNSAEIKVDLNAKTASFSINGTIVQTKDITNENIKSILFNTSLSGNENSGDIMIDDLTVKKMAEEQPVFTVGEIQKFSSKINDNDMATGFLAKVTAEREGTVSSIKWTVTQGEHSESVERESVTVKLAEGGSAYFGLIVEGMYDDPNDENDDAQCTFEIR